MNIPTKISQKTIIVFLTIYFFLLLLLYQLWYKNQFTSNFQFFNDSSEWLGIDKCGHFYIAYLETWFLIVLYQFCNQKPNLFVALFGFMCQLPIEIFDGFSVGYGFSVFDLLANFGGSAFAYFQFTIWKRQLIIPQFSFLPTEYALHRPEILGFNIFQQIIKDYNGQIYWLSFSPNDVLNRKIFPNWFLLSLGYGASNMLSGHQSSQFSDDRHQNIYLSIDINWVNFKSKKSYIKYILIVISHLKIPIFIKLV